MNLAVCRLPWKQRILCKECILIQGHILIHSLILVLQNDSHENSKSDGFMCSNLAFAKTGSSLNLSSAEVSNSPRAGMTEGWSLHLLKLVSRILTQTCCLSTNYVFVRVGIYRDNVKRMMRQPTCK
uniref:Uncharacterized protein n=1 Tax=Molossus molossus TaxID=27622 RepID=A0A7J8DT97_MOLMO|nr:hypothetical protein HJG59_009142 [Molossus molossus]